LRQTPEFQRGRTGEEATAQFLRSLGWFVIPSYDYSGAEDKAPRLQGLDIGYVLPDLDVSAYGTRLWVEVKTKYGASFTYSTQQLEHGIPLRHYLDYLEVERQTGNPVYLAIREEQTGACLIQRLGFLRAPRITRMKKGGKEQEAMAYFPRDAFEEIKDAHSLNTASAYDPDTATNSATECSDA